MTTTDIERAIAAMITAKIVWNDFIIFATRNKFTVRLSLRVSARHPVADAGEKGRALVTGRGPTISTFKL